MSGFRLKGTLIGALARMAACPSLLFRLTGLPRFRFAP